MRTALAALLLFLCGCTHNSQAYRETRLLMGSYVTIITADSDRPLAEQRAAVRLAFDEIKRLEKALSSFSNDNIIARINSSGTEETAVDDDTFYVIERALYFNRVSGGAFDITILPLLELWGFRGGRQRVPGSAEVAEVLKRVGSGKIALDPRKKTIRFLVEGMKLDLGGIAAGYAVDRAAGVLKENGIKNGLVDAGGDIRCFGKRSPEKHWSIGIRDPKIKTRIIEKILPDDAAITTSGGYEKFFEVKGRRYAHIIDPKTGCPVQNNILSATITAGDCLTADALATAAVAMGKEGALKMIANMDGVRAVIITGEGE